MNLLSSFLRSNSFFNVSNEHVSMFTVEPGEKIEKGDFVVVHTRTLLARTPKESNEHFAVGVAKRIVIDEHGNQLVVCMDGYHMIYDREKEITSDDIGKTGYFFDKETITCDPINKTKAGTIVDIEESDDPNDIEDGTDRIVWIKMDLTEGSDLEW